MQGRFTKRAEPAVIESECGCGCHQKLRIETDGEKEVRVLEGAAEPLVFAPLRDPRRSGESSIIDVF